MQDILEELLARWQEDRNRTPEDLCRDYPDLIVRLREQIALQLRIEQLSVRDAAVPFPHSSDPSS